MTLFIIVLLALNLVLFRLLQQAQKNNAEAIDILKSTMNLHILVVEEKDDVRYFDASNQAALDAAAWTVFQDRWKRGWYGPEAANVEEDTAWEFLKQHSGEVDGESVRIAEVHRA